MTDDHDLRTRAREAISAGKLPNRRPDRTWGGPGAGARCAVCDDIVTPADLELELEFSRNDGGADRIHAHARCFAVWELARHEQPQAEPAAPPNRVAAPAGAVRTGVWAAEWRPGRVLSERLDTGNNGVREHGRPDRPRPN